MSSYTAGVGSAVVGTSVVASVGYSVGPVGISLMTPAIPVGNEVGYSLDKVENVGISLGIAVGAVVGVSVVVVEVSARDQSDFLNEFLVNALTKVCRFLCITASIVSIKRRFIELECIFYYSSSF